jgi:hypothetical protein
VRLFVDNRPNLPDSLTPRFERFNLSRRPRRNRLRAPNGIGSSSQQRRHVIGITADSAPVGYLTVMASETRTTTDHDEIRQWVEEHDGSPAVVRGTERKNSRGVLRFDFPGGAGEDQLEHLSWDEWFGAFDSNELALLYQVQKSSGEDSTFFKLVNRDNS